MCVAPDGENTTFSVSDSGIGIAKEHLGRIFESFTQADGSTTRRFGGTGLGLAISHHLCELMGGRLFVESELGKGSRFSFSLPLRAASTAPVGHTAGVAGTRVLIVDDDATNRRVLSGYAKSIGLDATLSNSVAEALPAVSAACLAGAPFRIVFSDFHPSEIDGLNLLRAVHADPGLCGVHVLMLTSIDLPRFSAIRAELGVEHYLTKPVFLDDLLEVTRQILSRGERVVPAVVRASETKLRILVAEDNRVNQRVMSQLLARLGHEAHLVSNGRETVEAARAVRFDLILMDCQMPEVDGFMATRELRAAGDKTPIIALTAYALQGDRDKCIAAGMDGYLAKPVDFLELERTLAAYVHPGVDVRMPAEVPDHV